jgi:hypothetical protein
LIAAVAIETSRVQHRGDDDGLPEHVLEVPAARRWSRLMWL